MKKIITFIAFAVFFINCKAQTIVNISTYPKQNESNKYFKDINNNYQNFTGTWESTTGNITFRLILWKVTKDTYHINLNNFIDRIYGRFLIIQNAGNINESILHDSVKYFPQNGYTSDVILFAYATEPNEFGGSFTDTCANGGNGVLEAVFSLEILNLGSTPLQAQWNVTSTSRYLEAGESFTVPTNTILTKVN